MRTIKQIGMLNKSNGGTQPYQQDRIYDPEGGLVPALSSQLNGRILILVYEGVADV